MAKQFTFTTFDDPVTHRGGWQIKDASGLSDEEKVAEESFLTSGTRMEATKAEPIFVKPEERHTLETRLSFTKTDAGEVRLSQERPAGRDGSGRPGNTFTHTVIAPVAEIAREIGIPIHAFNAEWWLSPFGAKEVTASKLPLELDFSPAFHEHNWMEVLTNRTELPALLDALEITVKARLGGDTHRKLVVVECDETIYPDQWLEAIQNFCLTGNAWDIRFSTFERNVNPAKATALLAQGYDIVFTPDRDESGSGPIELFPLWQHGTRYPISENSVSWGQLLVALQMSVDSSRLRSVFDYFFTLAGDGALAISATPAWGVAALLRGQNDMEDLETDLNRLIVFNKPSGMAPDSEANQLYESAMSGILASSRDIVNDVNRMLSSMTDTEPALQAGILQSMLNKLIETPGELELLAPFANLNPVSPQVARLLRFPDVVTASDWSMGKVLCLLTLAQAISPNLEFYPVLNDYVVQVADFIIRLGTASIDDRTIDQFELLRPSIKSKVAGVLMQRIAELPSPCLNPSFTFRLVTLPDTHHRFKEEYALSIVRGDYQKNAARKDLDLFTSQSQDSGLQKYAFQCVQRLPATPEISKLRAQILQQVTDISWVKPYVSTNLDYLHILAPRIYSLPDRAEMWSWGEAARAQLTRQGIPYDPVVQVLLYTPGNPNDTVQSNLSQLRLLCAETERTGVSNSILFADAVFLLSNILVELVSTADDAEFQKLAESVVKDYPMMNQPADRVTQASLIDLLDVTCEQVINYLKGITDTAHIVETLAMSDAWSPDLASSVSAFCIVAHSAEPIPGFLKVKLRRGGVLWFQLIYEMNSQIIGMAEANKRGYLKSVREEANAWVDWIYQGSTVQVQSKDAEIVQYLEKNKKQGIVGQVLGGLSFGNILK